MTQHKKNYSNLASKTTKFRENCSQSRHIQSYLKLYPVHNSKETQYASQAIEGKLIRAMTSCRTLQFWFQNVRGVVGGSHRIDEHSFLIVLGPNSL